jgi:hypothetical protein
VAPDAGDRLMFLSVEINHRNGSYQAPPFRNDCGGDPIRLWFDCGGESHLYVYIIFMYGAVYIFG